MGVLGLGLGLGSVGWFDGEEAFGGTLWWMGTCCRCCCYCCGAEAEVDFEEGGFGGIHCDGSYYDDDDVGEG